MSTCRILISPISNEWCKMKGAYTFSFTFISIEIYELCNKFGQINSLMFKIIIICENHDYISSFFALMNKHSNFLMNILCTHAVNDTQNEPMIETEITIFFYYHKQQKQQVFLAKKNENKLIH